MKGTQKVDRLQKDVHEAGDIWNKFLEQAFESGTT